jgi:hypothetical protein
VYHSVLADAHVDVYHYSFKLKLELEWLVFTFLVLSSAKNILDIHNAAFESWVSTTRAAVVLTFLGGLVLVRGQVAFTRSGIIHSFAWLSLCST